MKKRYFITYGDMNYAESKKRIVEEAKATGIFDKIIAYSPDEVSERTKQSCLMTTKRGGGLWVWKPDILLQTINNATDGDKIVYCDAGCTLRKSREWNKYLQALDTYSIYAMKIHQKNYKWTRKEVCDYFSTNPTGWLNDWQCCATVVVVTVDALTRKFVEEWLTMMLDHPEFVQDVPPSEIHLQNEGFIGNRHDQTVYNALIFKFRDTGRIKIAWEHIEGYDLLMPQAIVASRLRNGERLTIKKKLFGTAKWIIKHIYNNFYK